MIRKLFLYTLLAFILSSCGNGFEESPLDNIVRELSGVPAYSVILYDMNVEGTVFEDYFHQYQIVKLNKNGEAEKTLTDWVQVPERVFEQHIDHVGMEIISKGEEGEVSKVAAPPGYSNFVGNPQYGQWVQSGGSSFWQFYGQYMFLNSLFNLATFPARRAYYDTYRRDYYGRRPYYGPVSTAGSRMFGTGSRYTSQTNAGSNWNSKSSSFKSRVRNSVTRSGSRYNSSGSMRSRGGGFGK
ncbi:hypothetical protein [Nafulsella turpanensis]|uniref:hypothetical protein n=1 Tax=Nafulsella turpanensis TaxID=1265690 RepID=UPI00034DD9AD|nr:hypothetical protein [Nafulsella turpanensis]